LATSQNPRDQIAVGDDTNRFRPIDNDKRSDGPLMHPLGNDIHCFSRTGGVHFSNTNAPN
jgi:hypothetical protein